MTQCRECGTEVGPRLLACPSCRALLHADRVQELIAEARAQESPAEAGRAYREALLLLPPGSRQHAWVTARIEESAQPGPLTGGASRSSAAMPAKLAALGAVGFLIFKLQGVIIFLLTKGKLLLAGLTQAGTVGSMLLSLGVYWAAFGWQLGLGLVLSIYVHEMGHVAAFRRYGIPATAPMFIPGLGAVVRSKAYPASQRESTRIALAGPIYGWAAAVLCYGIYLANGTKIWAALAGWGAFINLFNLLPFWQLDGGQAFRSLTRLQRGLVLVVIVVAFFFLREGLLLLIGALVGYQTVVGRAPDSPDWGAWFQYTGLLASLAVLAQMSLAQMASLT